MRDSGLQPFSGFMVPGMVFSTGHCIWLISWQRTPTGLGAFSEVWIFDPRGRRTCYIELADAVPVFHAFHAFDEVLPAELGWTWQEKTSLGVRVRARDTAVLDLKVALRPSLGSWILNGMIKLSPKALGASPLVQKVSSRAMDLLLGVGPVPIAGRTETGRRYRHEAERIIPVGTASGTYLGAALGDLCSPPGHIHVGDVPVPKRPFLSFCNHHLEWQPAGHAAGASSNAPELTEHPTSPTAQPS